ncbi:MAG: hypothetical protein M1838_001892 [Thelocarpon superellum]|nr:MAG: hypothetical protein M1838_001892 [Thelocarpon superellum]
MHTPEFFDSRYACSVGPLVTSTKVKIVDEQGRELRIDQPGEILARGPQMGYMDEHSLLVISDRLKEMIKFNCIAVAPAELEGLLHGHPMVDDVTVIGIPDDYAGETPKACVVVQAHVGAREGPKQVRRELLAYVRERIVRHEWVKEVDFVSEVRKSSSGKILRRVLRDQAKGVPKGVVVREELVNTAKL